jgi:hypothetical protein
MTVDPNTIPQSSDEEDSSSDGASDDGTAVLFGRTTSSSSHSTPAPVKGILTRTQSDDPLLSHNNFTTFTSSPGSNPSTPVLAPAESPAEPDDDESSVGDDVLFQSSPPLPAAPSSPLPAPPTSSTRTSIRVSVETAIKMEEGMFRDYILCAQPPEKTRPVEELI